jgi:hypothetical protein
MILAKEKVFSSTNIEEILDSGVKHFDHQAFTIALKDLEIQDDFTLNIRHDLIPNDLKILKKGLKNLCDILGLPFAPFAMKVCPENLFLHNLRELISKESDKLVTIVTDNILDSNEMYGVGFTISASDKLISMRNIIDHIPFTDKTKINFLCLTSNMLHFDIISDIENTFEFAEGQTTAIGYNVAGSVLSPLLSSRLYTMQLICSNGAVLPKVFGSTFTHGSGDRRYDKFFNRVIDGKFNRVEAIKSAFKWLNENTMNTSKFACYWNMVNKLIKDENITDGLFDVSEEVIRERFMLNVDDVKLKRKELLDDNIPFEDTKINYYDVFYNVTQHAQTLQPLNRIELTKNIGKFLSEARNN